MNVWTNAVARGSAGFLGLVVLLAGCNSSPPPSEIVEEVRRQLNELGQECRCVNKCYNPMGGLETGDCKDLSPKPIVTLIHPANGAQFDLPVGCYCSCSNHSIGSARVCEWDDLKAYEALDVLQPPEEG